MKLATITGTTDFSGQVTKGFGTLLLATGLDFADLGNRTITLFVERAGKNIDIVRDMLISDFLLLGTYGEDSLQSDTAYATIATVELTQDGGYIALGENEVIKYQLNGLDNSDVFVLYGIEEPAPSADLWKYERKTMASENLKQDFNTVGYDLLCMTNHSSITEVALTFDNGAVCTYDRFELAAMQRQNDPIAQVKQDGTVAQIIPDRLQIPLLGVVNVNIRKSAGTMLNLNLRIDELDYNRYQLKN